MLEMLRKAGLNKYEALAYMGLLKKGSLTGYEVAKESGVPLSKIYETLSYLLNKGLILSTTDKQKKYSALNPKIALNNFFLQKISEVEQARKEVDKYFESFKPASIEEDVVIYNSLKSRINIFENDLESSTKYYYSLFKQLPPITHPVAKVIKKKLAEGVDVRGIISSKEANKEMIKWVKAFPGVYKVADVTEKTRFAVTDDKIAHISILGKQVCLLRIKDNDFAKLMKKSFLEIWKQH